MTKEERGSERIVAVYDYTDEGGKLLYQNVRFDRRPEDRRPRFLPRRRDGNGDWIWDFKGVNRTLYRLPELLASSLQDFVFIAEGEKDVDTLHDLGLVATTSGSATSWKPEFAKYFRGRLVAITPDHDEPGERYAKGVAESLYGRAAEVRVLSLPGLKPPQKDITDWTNNGGTLKKLLELVEQTKPYKPAPERHLRHQVLSSVESQQTEYVWPEIIPMGMITGFVSQEGAGKSTVASDATMRVTTGSPWPNAPSISNPKGHVIIFAHEEDLSRVLKPRLTANGADLYRVVAGENIFTTANGEEEPFDIEQHVPELDALVDEYPETRLVIFDPVTSYVHCNENSNAQVRRALKPLIDFAARRNVGVLILSHLNKKVDLGMINRTIGSRAWSAVPRITWGIRTEQIEDEDGGKTDTDNRFLLCIKSNIGRKPKGLRFSIADPGIVVWDEERFNLTIDADCRVKTKRINEASDWLREYLGKKAMSATVVFGDGEKAGFNRALLNRAKENLGINPTKIGFGGEWFWELPK